jgi:hypothetical protein
MIGLLVFGVVLAVTGCLIALTLRLAGAVAIVGWWVLVCAEVVAATEILSLFDAIGRLGYAIFEMIALIAALIAWDRTGRHRPRVAIGNLPSRARKLARDEPLLAAMAGVVAVAVAYELFIIAATPPNNWDSMNYHLARVAAWRSRGDLGYFPTHNGIENAYPQNAEMLALWMLIWPARDVLVAVPQLVAALTGAASVGVIAERLGHSRRAAAFAALLFPTLTLVALESMTTQNDLIEASLVAAAVALALGTRFPESILAGLALGLAAGAKLTFLYAAVPVLVIGLLALPRRRAVTIGCSAVVAFAAVGMYAYVQNLAQTGRPQGNAAEFSSDPPHITVPGTASTIARTTYGLLDFSGFHTPTVITEHIDGAGKRLFDALHIPLNPPESTAGLRFGASVTTVPNEDWSAFGPLGFLLLLPLSVLFLWRWAVGKADRRHGALALALPLYIVALALGTRWNPYVERFVITAAALTLPLAAVVWRHRRLRLALAVVAIAALTLALGYDHAKPTGLAGTTPVWDRNRVDAQTIQRPDMLAVLAAVQRRVPQQARLGINLAPSDWEYPLWGPRLSRHLVWLPEQSSAGIGWVVLGSGVKARPPGRWCSSYFTRSHWTLLHRC